MKKYTVMGNKDGLYEAIKQGFNARAFFLLPIVTLKEFKSIFSFMVSLSALIFSVFQPLFLIGYFVLAILASVFYSDIVTEYKVKREPFKFWKVWRNIKAHSESEAILQIIDTHE